MPNGTTPVAFPISGFPHIATKDDSALWSIRDRISHAEGKLSRLTACRTNGVNHLVAMGKLTGITRIQYLFTIRRPSKYMTGG